MKFNKSFKALLVMTLLTFSAIVLFNTVSTSATGDVSPDIRAGDTIWYKVDQFTDLSQLIPTSADGGSIDGTLVGSQIYVKIMDIQDENIQYYDGSRVVSSLVPTVDIATGGILGSSITLTVPAEGGGTDTVVLPAGAGLPFPVNFGTVTLFNVSDFPESVLPVPLILNDDYVMHETVASEAAAAINSEGGTMTVTNNDAEFALSVDFENPESTDTVTLSASWRKTDGLLQSVEADLNIDGNAVIMKLVLDSKEYVPLNLDVGDKWSVEIADMGFEYLLAGFEPTEQADAAAQFDAILGQMDMLNGQVLMEFEVMEISGLYYRVDGMIWDGEATMVPFHDLVDTTDGWWFSGFGPLHYHMPKFSVGVNAMGEGTFISENVKQRMASLPGFVITPDWDIYASYDFTISAIVEGYESLLLDALAAETDVSGTMEMSFSGGGSNGGYEVSSAVDMDLTGPIDDTNPAAGTMNLQESSSSSMVYDKHGTLQKLEGTASGSIELSTGEKISISNGRMKFGITFDPVNPRDDDADGPIPGLDVPGFNFYLAILSVVSIVLIVRKRKY